MKRALALALLAAASVACQKSDPPGEKAVATTASAAPAGSASAAPVAAASAAPVAPAGGSAPVAAGAFAGKYDAKASTLYLPDNPEMKRVKWRGDDAPDGLGAGDLSLTIDADGRVHGESSGPLGALVVEGRAEGDAVNATLRRKDPTDGGFSGTMEGTRKGGEVSGEMRLTGYDAAVLRVASFKLAAK